MGNKRLDSIWDFSRYGYDLRAQCTCGHVSILPSSKLVMLVHHVPRQRDLEEIQRRLRCTKCRKRGASISAWPQA